MKRPRLVAFFSSALLVLALAALAAAAGAAPAAGETRFDYPYQNLGLGGGGGMYTPSISPHDPDFMFMSCDMTGVYRSVDGGRSWQIIPFRQLAGARWTKVLFDPKDPNTLYDVGGSWSEEGLNVSHDAGMTWTAIAPRRTFGGGIVVTMAIDRNDGRFLLAGTDKAAFASSDAGKTWRQCQGVGGAFKGFHITNVTGSRVVFAASATGLWRSDDSGETWKDSTKGIAGDELAGFCGGDDAKGGRCVLFCAMKSKAVDNRFAGGIFRSEDLGETWQSCMGEQSGLNTRLGKIDEWGAGDIAQYDLLTMGRNQVDTVYVAARGTGYWPPYHTTVYKSTDSGRTWKSVFSSDPRFPDANIEFGWLKYDLQWGVTEASGLGACDADPNVVLRTENGCTHVTTDGGRTWRAAYTRPAPGAAPGKKSRWESTGMEVTTTWHYYVSPGDPKRHYICYTDIGFARSEDGGRSWTHSPTGSPWANTFYDIAIDPAAPSAIYAACSNVHDIPHSTYTDIKGSSGKGGACVSADYGKTWKPIMNGLPEQPVTSVVLDPKSPEGSRTLYVSTWRDGIFKSTDGGGKWVRKVKGFGSETNKRTVMMEMAPSGALYAATGPIREGSQFPHFGGLFKSTDGAETWTCLNAQLQLGWQTGFAVDPRAEDTIYVCAASGWANHQGGLYKTADGGRTWRRVFDDGTPGFGTEGVQAMFVTIHPDDSKVLYLGTDGHGLWLSRDAGATWRLMDKFPFGTVHRVAFDPQDHSTIYVTTFGGGVWKGPAM